MNYFVQAILFLIVLYASIKAKKQYKRALDNKVIDFGRYRLNPIKGEKAVRLSRIALFIAKSGPWIVAILLLIYNLLEMK